MIRPHSRSEDKPEQPSRLGLHVLTVCLWLLIVVTFTRPGRHEVSAATSVDWIAAAKMGSRAIALVLLAAVAVTLWGRRGWAQTVTSLLPLGLFATWGLLSVAWSPKPSLSLAQAGGLAILVLLAGVTALVVRTDRDLSHYLAHISLALMTVSGVLIVAQIALPHLGGLGRSAAGGGAMGLLHPTVAGSTASLGILVLLGARLWWPWRWARLAFWPGLAMHIVILLLSNTRLAIALTALIGLAILAIALPRTAVMTSVLLVSVLTACYLVLDANVEYGRQGSSVVWEYTRRGQSARELSSLSGRGEIWPLMWDSILESPIIGHGYYVTSSQGNVRVWHAKGNYSAHNIGLQLLVTLGVVGFALFLWGLARPLSAFFRCDFKNDDGQRLQWLLAAVWLWFLGWGMLNASIAAPFQPEATVFFALLGVAQAKVVEHLGSKERWIASIARSRPFRAAPDALNLG